MLDEAAEEMTAAATWYEQRRPGLGDRFLDAVEATVQFIREAPLAGSLVPLPDLTVPVRRQPVPGFPFVINYITEPALSVVAVAHTSRRPGYWRARLGRR